MLKHSLAFLAIELTSQQAMADALPILVMIADGDGNITFFNEAWFEYTGQSDGITSERAWQNYLHPDDRERVTADWLSAIMAGADAVDTHYRLREARTGAYRWFHARAIAIRDGSAKIVQWIGAAIDVDDERRKQLDFSKLYNEAQSVATAMQRASLPSSMPHVESLRFEALYASSYSSMTIGGDWYDAFRLPDGSTVLTIGDVTGHGLEAAVLMGKLRYSLRALTLQSGEYRLGDPATILRSAEEAFFTEHPDQSATAFLGIISPDNRGMRYASAGHPPPLLLALSGQTTWLAYGEPPLGWRFSVARGNHLATLTDTSCLLLYTDGLVETGRDIIAGMNRLEVAMRHADLQPDQDFLPALVAEVTVSHPHDDVAILAVTFLETLGQATASASSRHNLR